MVAHIQATAPVKVEAGVPWCRATCTLAAARLAVFKKTPVERVGHTNTSCLQQPTRDVRYGRGIILL